MTAETTVQDLAEEHGYTAPTAPTLRTLTARTKNPALLVDGGLKALSGLGQLTRGHGVPDRTLELVHLRTSQINGCAWCVDFGVRAMQKAGESADRLAAVAAFRESPLFSEAEAAALELAESVTRIADQTDRVPDTVWAHAAEHYDEQALGVLVLHVSMTNLFNRINVATRQVAGQF